MDLRAPLLTPGARLCAIKNCAHIIPSIAEYRWKMCEPCRVHAKTLSRQRKEAKFNGATESTLPGMPRAIAVDNSHSDDSDDIPLVSFSYICHGFKSLMSTQAASLDKTATDSRASNRCSSRDCGILLNPGTTGIECTQCLTRKLAVNQVDMTRTPRRIPRSSKEAKRKHKHHQSHTPKVCPNSQILFFT